MNKKFAIILAVVVLALASMACGGPDLVCPNGPTGGCTVEGEGAGINNPLMQTSGIEQAIINMVDDNPNDNALP